jgi:hypothetical protein
MGAVGPLHAPFFGIRGETLMRLVSPIITRIGTLALIGCLAWLGWANLRPQKPQIGAVRKNLADGAISSRVGDERQQAEASPGSALALTGQEEARIFSWSQRLLGWLLAVLLLPVFTINFMRAMFHRNSNRSNAFVLAVYTLADALLAWLLVGGALSSWWTVAIFILAVAAAFAYNIRIMTFVLTLET